MEIYNNIILANTGYCNLNCIHCGYKYKKEKQIQTLNEWKYIVDKCVDYGFTWIGVCPLAGDIFTDKLIYEKLDYINTKNISFYPMSNMVSPNFDAKKMYTYDKMDHFAFSIYGNDYEEFNKFTNGSKKQYDIFLKNLDDVLSLNWRLNVKFWTLEKNKNKLLINSKLYQKCFKHKVEGKIFRFECGIPDRNWGNNITSNKYFNIQQINNNINELRQKPCHILLSKPHVYENGDVVLCGCWDIKRNTKIGNIFTDKMEDIFNINKYFKQYEICEKCNMYSDVYNLTSKNINKKELIHIYEKINTICNKYV